MMRRIPAIERLTPSFRQGEFACRCRSAGCDAVPMDKAFMAKLEETRQAWGRPLIISSGVRCGHYNRKVGGAEKSQHLTGNAADIFFDDADERDAFVGLAKKMGWNGIGLGRLFVHVDNRAHPVKPWTY